MASIQELTVYVKAHPYHFVERWRLAKKLYKIGEYHLAITHLEVLEEDWEPKASLVRYLAAAYSRVSQSDKAIKVLKSGVASWPTDIEMLEQLAMELRKIGEEDASIATLEKIMKIDPNYRLPQNAKERILEKKLGGYQARPVKQSKGKTEGTECGRCGAQNKSDESQCWQCKANLDLFGDIVNQSSAIKDYSGGSSSRPRSIDYGGLILKFMIVVLAVYGGYHTYGALAQGEFRESGFTIASSFEEWLRVDMVMSRIVLGGMLLVLSPFLLQLAYHLSGSKQVLNEVAFFQATFFSTLAYALTWVPGVSVLAWVLIMLLSSFMLLLCQFWRQWLFIVSSFFMYWVFTTFLIIVIVISVHGLGAFLDVPKIMAFSSTSGEASPTQLNGETPLKYQFQWHSTDSEWMDGEFKTVALKIDTIGVFPDKGVKIEFRGDDGSVLIYKDLLIPEVVLYSEAIKLGVTYTLELRSESPVTMKVEIIGLLPVKVVE